MNISIGTSLGMGGHPFEIENNKHVLLIGETGVGKSTLAENIAIARIRQGAAVCFVDPHGTSISTIAAHIPRSRVANVVHFKPTLDQVIGLNPFDIGKAKGEAAKRAIDRARDAFENMIQTVWPHGWGPETANILAYSFKAIADAVHKPTVIHLVRFLMNARYRKTVVSCVEDADVAAYFTGTYDGEWDKRMRAEKSAPLMNKLSRFILDHSMKLVMAWPDSFDFAAAMDRRQVVLIDLAQAELGRELAQFLGSVVVHKIAMAALTRDPKKGDVFVLLDEFGAFLSGTDVSLFLAESRKMGVFITLIAQTLAQMDEKLRAIALGNTGTKIVFRVGGDDAHLFEREFAGKISASAFQELMNFRCYVRTVRDGVPQKPEQVMCDPTPIKQPDEALRSSVYKQSHDNWGIKRSAIEKSIETFYEELEP